MPTRKRLVRFSCAAMAFAALAMPALGHHSFAMYDRSRLIVFTGVVARIEPNTNHLMILFSPMNEERNAVLRDDEGEPVIWALEMQAASAVAQFGITESGFPPGTIFSGAFNPARDGALTGSQVVGERNERALFRCPSRMRPQPGMHCNSVEGSTTHGTVESLPEPNSNFE